MNVALNYLPEIAGAWRAAVRTSVIFVALALAACGGGSGSSTNTDSTASCDPANPGTFDQCGTVIVGFTDADGDFLNYTVDVLSLQLEADDGRVVETLPRTPSREAIWMALISTVGNNSRAATTCPASWYAMCSRVSFIVAPFLFSGGDRRAEATTQLWRTPSVDATGSERIWWKATPALTRY